LDQESVVRTQASRVSKIEPGIPARGFFLAAQVLGVFSGDPTGPEARAFQLELQRVLSFYRS
jgi:hypothetical protein